MVEEKFFKIRFNEILIEEMGKQFNLKPLPLDPVFKEQSPENDKSVLIESDYLQVFCDCISKAEPLTDPERCSRRNAHMERYISDYLEKDVGGAPLKNHFGKEWGERYMKEFFFSP
jgi:hypothetical protein